MSILTNMTVLELIGHIGLIGMVYCFIQLLIIAITKNY